MKYLFMGAALMAATLFSPAVAQEVIYNPSTPQAELDRKPPGLLAHASRGNFPAEDHDGRRFEPSRFAALRSDLTQRFEGVTAFTRAPAERVTREHGKTVHDNIIIFEVMVESLDRDWLGVPQEKPGRNPS